MADRGRIQPDRERADVELGGFLDRLRGERLIFFPVRHHSPACAWHLERLIEEAAPASILIEGPETFDRFIPQILDPETVAPVAVYTGFVAGGKDGPRQASFYPLCDYSPELVALRAGAAAGARLSFCDLDYLRQAGAEDGDDGGRRRLTSLLEESHLQESDYLRALAERRGCRDPHELWDRLFESRFRGSDTEDFVRGVAAYCWFARCHTPAARLEGDGTLAREAHMWRRIQNELRRLKRRKIARPLLVVTGGFHTPALALGWPRRWQAAPDRPPRGEVLEALIPYSFVQLDALNGYAAGMPSPGFYQRLWRADGDSAGDCVGGSAGGDDAGECFAAAALELLTELPAKLREVKSSLQLSTADAIAAFAHTRLLAKARGNPGPLREDLLDGMRSCFVKGELDVEGQLVLDLALELMRGDAIGRLPASAELHPLLADFHDQAKVLGLDLDSAAPRRLALEIYRKPRHRQRSRLFHRLGFLEVPFARFTGGPDFVGGRDLDLQIEHWECVWSPQTDSALIDKTVYGASVEEACAGLLQEHLEALQDDRSELGAPDAVGALMLCLRLDLDRHLGPLVAVAGDKLAQESSLARCVEAAAQLQTLLDLPGPGGHDALPEVERLAADAYQRSCRLVRELPGCPESAVDESLEALGRLREVVIADGGRDASGEQDRAAEHLDPALLWDAARAASPRRGANGTLSPAQGSSDREAPATPEAIRGGLAGLLFAGGEMSREDLEAHMLAGLQGAGPDGSTAPAYLRGLFALCRELTWQSRAVMERVNGLLAGWDESQFHQALPHLRLAFAQHTPRETDRVARLLQGFHGSDTAIDWYQRAHEESFVAANAAVAARVAECLERDGLGHFLEPS